MRETTRDIAMQNSSHISRPYKDPAAMTPEERVVEIAEILAAGFWRLKAREGYEEVPVSAMAQEPPIQRLDRECSLSLC